MANYLITGGAGFIGSHLAEALLAANHQVTVLDNLSTGEVKNIPEGAKFCEGSILDQELLREILAQVDGCFHLAAIVSVPICDQDWLNAFQVNVAGTLAVMYQALKQQNGVKTVPVVFASSAAIYGNNQHFPLKEKETPTPISSYGLHKTDCENYAALANQLFQLPITALRLFNVYGARQRADSSYAGVITKFSNNLAQQQPIVIFGDGSQTRDFIYVKDVVRFFIQAMDTSTTNLRIFNACTGKSTSVLEIAKILCEIYGVDFAPVFEAPRLNDIYRSLGSCHKSKQELGITAHTSIKEGLRQSLQN